MLPHKRDQRATRLKKAQAGSPLPLRREELIDYCNACLIERISFERLVWVEWDRTINAPKRLRLRPYRLSSVKDAGANPGSEWQNYMPVFQFIWDWETLNPIRRRSYLHDPDYHQLAYRFASTSSADTILSISRASSRFSDRSIQILKSVCDTIAPVATAIHSKEDAEEKSNAIASMLEQHYGLQKTNQLSNGELELLNEVTKGRKIRAIARSKHVRRDTVSRQLSSARQKLGLESNKELISVLRPHPSF